MTQIKGLEKLDPETTKALVKAGYKSMKSIAIAIPADIIGDTGLSESVVEEIIAKSISNVSFPPLSAAELLKIEQNKGKLTTGSNSLDDLLAGGPWTGEITEISGVFSTGKSQLCFQLAVTAQLDRGSGGLEGKVFFVDSEGTFSATRIGEMAIALDLDPHEILKNIFVARVLDSQQQTRVIQKISEIAESENIRLVIVDSIAAHFRSDY
ncbi:MAG: DNA repair and recombination protein RadA, partial [Candidatus Heimdallarchaeota archaeon]|nr:DNA repair and recombination protein RadA [Candidatus Heimdallarchaeota archaeon]